MKKSGSLHSVKRCCRQPAVLDFNDLLRDEAEAHEFMRLSQSRSRPEEISKTGFHKPLTKLFATASKKIILDPSLQCKGKHPLWSCSVFKDKTTTQRAQFSAQNRLCFAFLQRDQLFRICPKVRKCPKSACESSHNVLLHGVEKVFSARLRNKEINISNNTSHSSSNKTAQPNRKKPQTFSLTVATVAVWQETHKNPSCAWIANKFKHRRDHYSCNVWFLLYPLMGFGRSCTAFKFKWEKRDILVNEFNSTESVPTQQVEVNVFAKFDHHEYSFLITPFVKDSLSVGLRNDWRSNPARQISTYASN